MPWKLRVKKICILAFQAPFYSFTFIFLYFYFHRNAADHEYYFVGTGGYVLVHPSLHVGEAALYGVVAYLSAPYFVGYEDECGVLGGKAVKLTFYFGKRFFNRWLPSVFVTVEEEVGTP